MMSFRKLRSLHTCLQQLVVALQLCANSNDATAVFNQMRSQRSRVPEPAGPACQFAKSNDDGIGGLTVSLRVARLPNDGRLAKSELGECSSPAGLGHLLQCSEPLS